MSRLLEKPGTIELGACELDELRNQQRILVAMERQGIRHAGQIMEAAGATPPPPGRLGHHKGKRRMS